MGTDSPDFLKRRTWQQRPSRSPSDGEAPAQSPSSATGRLRRRADHLAPPPADALPVAPEPAQSTRPPKKTPGSARPSEAASRPAGKNGNNGENRRPPKANTRSAKQPEATQAFPTATRRVPQNNAASKPVSARNPLTDPERPLAGGVKGRRTAAFQEELAAARAPLPEPRPPLLSRTIVWGTAILCALLLLATCGEAWTVHQLSQQATAEQQQVNQLQAQNTQIAANNQNLQQSDTIEQEARRLGFIFPGDQPVAVVSGSPPPPSASKPPPPVPNPWGFWPDWLKLFFGG